MGQRLSRASWNASSNNDPRGLNYTNQYTNNELHQFIDHPTVILEYPHQDEAKTAIVSQTSVSAETSSPSATSASASLSNQVIIRIQLTKMENNNSNDNLEIDDNTNNVSQSASAISPSTSPSLASAALTRPTSSTNSGTTYPSPDNNLNIPCSGAHIRLTISNICDPPLANSSRTISNNLNIDRNSNPANSQSIQCLNIVEDHHSASNENDFYNSPDNDAWRRTSPDSNRRQTRNTSCTCNGNRMNGGGCAAFNVEGISCSCTGYRKKAIGRDCLSGHSSLCSQSGHEADSRHCCRVKKTSNNYPSKFRCCICRESLANAANNNNSNNRSSSSSPINDADERSYNCRSSNCATVSSCRNNQAVAVSSQPQTPQNRQIFQHINQPVGQNVIVLSVNSNVPRLIVDSPRFQQEFELVLPAGSVVCSPSASTAGVSGVSGVVSSHFGPMIHSQADYSHCLVPDLEKITNCSFYWGKMDRYEAERLLEGKPEGTFLLRDSAQDEYLFSVTFRKYNRSLHARIEQLGHKFSFDCHDPGVYTASTVTGLLEHYKDPSCVMFFEPMLMIPLHRNFSFSLQQLCRATVVSHITYDGINDLQLPSSLKSYLKEYHYKYKIRETPLDDSLYPSS